MYFLGRLLKSFPRSGTDILLQSSLFLSLKLPVGIPSSSNLMTVRGELRRISFCVPDLPEEARDGREGSSRESGPRDREMDLEYPAEEESSTSRPLLPSRDSRDDRLLGGLSADMYVSDSGTVE